MPAARGGATSFFFFRDEVPAVLESTFDAADAARIRCPVLVVEGGDSAVSGPLSGQITALATRLLPHAEVVRLPGTSHMMPLQDPEGLAQMIQRFIAKRS